MVKDSEVALIISLKEPTGSGVTTHLGVSPTQIRESKGSSRTPAGEMESRVFYSWVLHSPKDQTFQLTARLEALVAAITPFSERLVSLDPSYRRWIDIVYQITPQEPTKRQSVLVEGFHVPHGTFKKLGAWNLSISYETFYFDHLPRRKDSSLLRALFTKHKGRN
jgi:hypothetical protein